MTRPNGSWGGGTRTRHSYIYRQRRASAVGGAEGNGGKGGNRRSGRKPDRGNGGRGGNGRSRRETAVDECRKETADRAAGPQADY